MTETWNNPSHCFHDPKVWEEYFSPDTDAKTSLRSLWTYSPPPYASKSASPCLFFLFFWFVVIKPENPHFASRPGLEVIPLSISLGCVVFLRSYKWYITAQNHSTCKMRLTHWQVDGLARIPWTTQALPWHLRILTEPPLEEVRSHTFCF